MVGHDELCCCESHLFNTHHANGWSYPFIFLMLGHYWDLNPWPQPLLEPGSASNEARVLVMGHYILQCARVMFSRGHTQEEGSWRG